MRTKDNPIARVCTPKSLPSRDHVAAARTAVGINPVNEPRLDRFAAAFPDVPITLERAAVMTSKYWGPVGIRLTVGFIDGASAALQKRILSHMNAWSKTANVKF